MTNKQAQKFLEETRSKELVEEIVEHFNGESIGEVKKFIRVLRFYLTENCFVDSELAKSQLDFEDFPKS